MQTVKGYVLVAGIVLAAVMAGAPVQADLSPTIKADLGNSKYVYIATSRKNGSFGKPAEIWFMYRDGAVYVASPPTTWRVRRIKAGRPLVKIAVGKPDGPSFMATGALVNEPNVYPVLFETYAKKYPDGWPKFEEGFRKGFANGSRVLIKYVPREAVDNR